MEHEAENGYRPEHEGKPFCGDVFRNFGCTQVKDHESIHVARDSHGKVVVEWAK